MRILAGEAKGRVLKTREGNGTRPTDSRSREMLFNIISDRVIDAKVLDLYAGTGSVGLEALSRGAASCTFIEQNNVACRVIRDNVKMLSYEERVEVWTANVRTGLSRLIGNNAGFDIVFADPPFVRQGELTELCQALDNSAELLHNGTGQFVPILVVQHHFKAVPVLSRFSLEQERRAGESILSFYQAIHTH